MCLASHAFNVLHFLNKPKFHCIAFWMVCVLRLDFEAMPVTMAAKLKCDWVSSSHANKEIS
jgi:hypothetical protein